MLNPECAFPLAGGQLEKILHRLLGGSVVDQDVQAAQVMHGLVDGPLAVGFLGQVAADGHAPVPGLLDQAGGVLCVLVLLLGQVGDGHVGAFLGERDGDRPADA